jgi:hypothetical protein
MNLQPQNVSQAVSFNHLSMPYLRAFVGLILIGLSLYATIGFMSQGFTGLAFLGVVVFCLCVEAVKILFTGDIGFYLSLKMPEKAMLSAVIVMILFCLSVGSETWFLLSGSMKGATQIEQSAKQTETLQAQIDAKSAQLASCNPTVLTKCVNPRTAELSALQAQMTALSAASAVNEEAIANAKFWEQAAKSTGTTPENLQMGLDIVRAVLQELFGLLLLGQYSTWKRLKNLESAPAVSEERDITPQVQVQTQAAPMVAPPVALPQTQAAVYHPPRPQAAPVQVVSSGAASEVRKATRRNPTRSSSIWTPKEERQLFMAHVEELRKQNADLKRTKAVSAVSDYDPESSIFDTPLKSAPPTGKVKPTSAMDISRLSPKD